MYFVELCAYYHIMNVMPHECVFFFFFLVNPPPFGNLDSVVVPQASYVFEMIDSSIFCLVKVPTLKPSMQKWGKVSHAPGWLHGAHNHCFPENFLDCATLDLAKRKPNISKGNLLIYNNLMLFSFFFCINHVFSCHYAVYTAVYGCSTCFPVSPPM